MYTLRAILFGLQHAELSEVWFVRVSNDAMAIQFKVDRLQIIVVAKNISTCRNFQ